MAAAAFQSILPGILPFPIPRSLQRVFGRVFGIDEIARVYDRIRNTGQARSIADRLLDFLEISYTTSEADLARIPVSGSAIVTVNHPFGILDGAILASLLTRIRPEVRFLANGILSVVPELREVVIPSIQSQGVPRPAATAAG
jgi:putative hemolysin